MILENDKCKSIPETITLFRPVGPIDLELIKNSNWSAFPSRLSDQPIFYPVFNQEYAEQIARDWNAKSSGSGFVTKFQIEKSFIEKYEIHKVGGQIYLELWVPANELDELNKHIIGKIELIKEFYQEIEKE